MWVQFGELLMGASTSFVSPATSFYRWQATRSTFVDTGNFTMFGQPRLWKEPKFKTTYYTPTYSGQHVGLSFKIFSILTHLSRNCPCTISHANYPIGFVVADLSLRPPQGLVETSENRSKSSFFRGVLEVNIILFWQGGGGKLKAAQ